jgi:hypothetical protein
MADALDARRAVGVRVLVGLLRFGQLVLAARAFAEVPALRTYGCAQSQRAEKNAAAIAR